MIVSLDTTLIPKVRRLTKFGKELVLKNQKNIKKVPVCWDFETHVLFLAFLGYWSVKGYYDQQSVVISVGQDLSGLMPVFDYVCDLFKCNYRIKKYKVVYFDSALLKYTMMALGFPPNVHKDARVHPGWIDDLPAHLLKMFLKGFITACSKVRQAGIYLYPLTPEIVFLATKLKNRFWVGCKWVDDKSLHIGPSSLAFFRENIGFLSDYKTTQLEKLLFVETL